MRPILFALASALAGAFAAHLVQTESGDANVVVTALVGAMLGALGYYRGTIGVGTKTDA